MSYSLPAWVNDAPPAESADNLLLYNTAINDLDARIVSRPNWSIDPASANGVKRLRHSTQNFLPNASYEYWNNGTNVAPDNWFYQGGIALARSTFAATSGTYSAQMTFGTTNDGVFYTDIGVDPQVDYTYSCFVQRLSGTGLIRLVAQQDFGSFTEYVSVDAFNNNNLQELMLTFKPTTNGLTRFAIHSKDTNASVWIVDESMAQESLGIATTFQPSMITDTFNQSIFGDKYFKGAITVPSSITANRRSASSAGIGAIAYDITLNKPIFSDGTNWRDASGTIV